MEGAFERINAKILRNGTTTQVVSLVGRVVNFDGVDTATIEAADGGHVQVTQVDVGSFNYVPNMICEIMGGPVTENSIQVSVDNLCFCVGLKSPTTHNKCLHLTVHVTNKYVHHTTKRIILQFFICRDMGEDFDLGNYNKLIENVMKNPKYADIFE
jgi:hypothetical protein